MLALSFHRSLPRYALVRATQGRAATTEVGLLHLSDIPEPRLPGPGWVRLRPSLAGICGSDLATVYGDASLYLDPLTSYPFVPGHEVVGILDDGARVALQPALGCQVRGIDPPCAQCAQGWFARCENLTEGDLEVGLQSGYCRSTGGGWGEVMVAHSSQLHRLPDTLSDEAAVLLEPLACAVHAALRGEVGKDDTVVVQGAGTMGLLTIAAVRRLCDPARLIAIAKHPKQKEEASRLGADFVVDAKDPLGRIRFQTRARRLDGQGLSLLLGGPEVTFECTGTSSGLSQAARYTRAGGRLVVVGMPGEVEVDVGAIWQRELTVLGAYAYGVEKDGRTSFEKALEIAPSLSLERLSGPFFPLSEYARALEYARRAGSLGCVKVGFDLRDLRV